MAQHGDSRRARAVILVREQTPERRTDSQRGEVVAGNEKRPHTFRLPIGTQSHRTVTVRGKHRREGAGGLPHLLVDL